MYLFKNAVSVIIIIKMIMLLLIPKSAINYPAREQKDITYIHAMKE